MTDPNRNPIVWLLMSYLAVSGGTMIGGQAFAMPWLAVIGGSMLLLVMVVATLAAAYIAYDALRGRFGRR